MSRCSNSSEAPGRHDLPAHEVTHQSTSVASGSSARSLVSPGPRSAMPYCCHPAPGAGPNRTSRGGVVEKFVDTQRTGVRRPPRTCFVHPASADPSDRLPRSEIKSRNFSVTSRSPVSMSRARARCTGSALIRCSSGVEEPMRRRALTCEKATSVGCPCRPAPSTDRSRTHRSTPAGRLVPVEPPCVQHDFVLRAT